MATIEAETAAQLFSRLCGKPKLSLLAGKFFKDEKKNFIELCGPPSSGKTEILMDIMVGVIKPKVFEQFQLDGFESTVVFIDSSYKFSMLRFVSLLEEQLIQSVKGTQQQHISSELTEKFLKHCLKRFFKMTCSSTKELFVSLGSLELFLKSTPDVVLLIVDDICANHWIDNLNITRNKNTANQSTTENVYKLLHKYTDEHNVNVIVTKQPSFQTSKSSNVSRYQTEVKDIKNSLFGLSRKSHTAQPSFTFKVASKYLEVL